MTASSNPRPSAISRRAASAPSRCASRAAARWGGSANGRRFSCAASRCARCAAARSTSIRSARACASTRIITSRKSVCLFTPQYFDAPERALLAERLKGDFVFLDIGASVGGYALFVAGLGGPRARILAVEPLPEVFERLAYNIRQSEFANVKAVCCALADIDGEITLFVNTSNQGETSIRIVSAEARVEQMRVRAKKLLTLVREEGYGKIDAIKLDIEGAEDLVLDPFLSEAPPALWPRLVIMEFSLLRVGALLEERLRALGYREILRTGENVAYELDGEGPRR